MYSLETYNYTLPAEKIAQESVHPHHDAKLMVIDRKSGDIISHSTFWNLDAFIPDNRVIFFNNSRVIPARIRLDNIKCVSEDGKESIIKKGEILVCQRCVNGSYDCLVQPGRRFKVGTKIFLGKAIIEVVGVSQNGRFLQSSGMTMESLMEEYGELPLPPYIEYKKSKEADYQTVFAKKDGSVAAPTASLHFTKELLEKIPNKKEYVTLHVGLGTFQGVSSEDIRDHSIHQEMIEVELEIFEKIYALKKNGGKILAVGTTTCRTLESLVYVWKKLQAETIEKFSQDTQEYWNDIVSTLVDGDDYIDEMMILPSLDREKADSSVIQFQTKIFIYPGKVFYIIDDLITNFHLPKSSLLMLVSAFMTRDIVLGLYELAKEHGYRFFSLGDGMYIRS